MSGAGKLFKANENSEKAIKDRVLNTVPPKLRSNYSRELRHLVTQMLIKDPDKRPEPDKLLHLPMFTRLPTEKRGAQYLLSLPKKDTQSIEMQTEECIQQKPRKSKAMIERD